MVHDDLIDYYYSPISPTHEPHSEYYREACAGGTWTVRYEGQVAVRCFEVRGYRADIGVLLEFAIPWPHTLGHAGYRVPGSVIRLRVEVLREKGLIAC